MITAYVVWLAARAGWRWGHQKKDAESGADAEGNEAAADAEGGGVEEPLLAAHGLAPASDDEHITLDVSHPAGDLIDEGAHPALQPVGASSAAEEAQP